MNTDLLIEIPPDFDPEGLRVYRASGADDDHTTPRASLVLGHDPDDGSLDLWDGSGPWAAERRHVRLSVGDARTRDALARWVADRVAVDVIRGVTFGYDEMEDAWVLSGADRRGGVLFDWMDVGRPTDVIVSSLEPLEPLLQEDSGDPRLPDGSRRVDGLALAAVVRHLTAGGS